MSQIYCRKRARPNRPGYGAWHKYDMSPTDGISTAICGESFRPLEMEARSVRPTTGRICRKCEPIPRRK